MILFLLFQLFTVSVSLQTKLCIVGGNSGLGKEIVYQAIYDYNTTVLSLSNKVKTSSIPCRVNSFNEIQNPEIFTHPNLANDCYWNDITKFDYHHIIFTTSAKPFENDYSDILMKKFLENISSSCKSITLVSAYGVSETLKKSNLGIKVMNAWYLKDVYRAKNEQEKMLKNIKISKFIVRPKALSYGKTTYLESQSRQDLANDILMNII